MPSHPPLLQALNVHYDYPDGTRALRGASLSVRRGEFWVLVGPNGSGKTTLARHLNGLLLPQSGEVLVDGTPTSNVPRGALARRVALCFQNPDHQLFSPTVDEEVGFAPRALGFTAARRKEVVERALESMGVAGLRWRNPFALSMGQRHLVALAAALAQDADALVLDEPTQGLDLAARERLARALARLTEEDRAVLVITHDLEWAWEHAQRAALMERGRVVGAGDIGLLVSGLARRLKLTPALASLDAAISGGGPPRAPKALAAATAARYGAKAGAAPEGR